MIRRLLATTALAGFVATSAFAQSTTTPTAQPSATAPASDGQMAPAETPAAAPVAPGATGAQSGQTMAEQPAQSAGEVRYLTALGADQHLASDLDGADVYASSAADAPKVGDIENLLIGKDGKIVAAIVDTDKFLDEDKTVAVPYDKITWTKTNDSTTPRAVLTATREELVPAPTFTETPASAENDASGATPGAATTDTMPVANDTSYPATVGADQYLAKAMIGQTISSGPGEDAQTIGNVNDLVVGNAGEIAAVVVGVGGFLGIGEKDVGVPFDAITMSRDADGKARAILAANKDQLNAAPTFETDVNSSTTAANTGSATTGAATGTGMAADSTTGAMAPASTADTTTTASTGNTSDRSQLVPVSGPELTAEKVVGTTVYGPNDENIGKVGDIALTADGKVDAVIVDVGGFLGIGSKQVAVAMDNLKFMADKSGSMTLYTEFTQAQLESAPQYDSNTYAQNRATMRIEPGATLAPATAPASANP